MRNSIEDFMELKAPPMNDVVDRSGVCRSILSLCRSGRMVMSPDEAAMLASCGLFKEGREEIHQAFLKRVRSRIRLFRRKAVQGLA